LTVPRLFIDQETLDSPPSERVVGVEGGLNVKEEEYGVRVKLRVGVIRCRTYQSVTDTFRFLVSYGIAVYPQPRLSGRTRTLSNLIPFLSSKEESRYQVPRDT